MLKKCLLSVLGLALLPAVAGLSTLLYQILVSLQMTGPGSRLLNRFVLGAGAWMLFFFGVSRPLRSYIFAHEASHLLAAWMSGVRAGRLRVGRSGGSVEVARSSLWIALAPYLLPFYSLLIVFAHYLAQLWCDPALWTPWLPLALGTSWGFHFTFTLYTLSRHQSDIGPYGRLGAYTLILAGNLLWLLFALMVVQPLPLQEELHWFLREQQRTYTTALSGLRELFYHLKNAIIRG